MIVSGTARFAVPLRQLITFTETTEAKMNWNKLKPWNWFKKEQNQPSTSLPARRAPYETRPWAALHAELDRLLEPFWRGFGGPVAPEWGLEGGWLRPSVDISENRKGYTIRVEIPGVEREDIHLTLEDDTLVISGEKKQEQEAEEGGYHCVERSYGAFRRMISLPADADQSRLEAKFRNGVLTITLPRRADASSKAREVAIS